MRGMNDSKNLEALLRAMDELKDKASVDARDASLLKDAARTSKSMLADKAGTIVGKGSDIVSEGIPNFTMRDIAEDMLPVKQSNLPDIAGEVVDRSDEVSRALVKSGARTPSTIAKTAGKVASKSLGPLLGIAGAVLGEDQVQAATLDEDLRNLPFDERLKEYQVRQGMRRSDEDLSKIVNAGLAGNETQDYLTNLVEDIPLRPYESPKSTSSESDIIKEFGNMLASSDSTSDKLKTMQEEASKTPTVEKKNEEKSENVKPSVKTQGKPSEQSIVDKYQELLNKYEEERKKASGKDLMVQGVQSLMDAFAQYDLAGGGQFAGLKPIKTKVPELGFGKQVENKFNKQLQLEGLKRKEEELKNKRLQSLSKLKESGMELSKGQEARDKAFAKDYAQFANAGGYASIRKNLTTLQGVVEKLKGSELTGGVMERFAPESARDYYRKAFDQEAQDVKDQVEQVIQQSLRQTLGAQFTEKEATRLIERSYNPALSPEKNIQRLNSTINELDSMARAKELSGRYFEKNGTLAGYQAPLGGSPKKESLKSNEVRRRTKDGKTAIFDADTKKFLRYE